MSVIIVCVCTAMKRKIKILIWFDLIWFEHWFVDLSDKERKEFNSGPHQLDPGDCLVAGREQPGVRRQGGPPHALGSAERPATRQNHDRTQAVDHLPRMGAPPPRHWGHTAVSTYGTSLGMIRKDPERSGYLGQRSGFILCGSGSSIKKKLDPDSEDQNAESLQM